MNNVIKKVIAILCVFSVILGMFRPVPVKATNYSRKSNIIVGETFIVRGGFEECLTVAGDRGEAVYNPADNTLLLDNLEITGNTTIKIRDIPDITILVKGTVNLHCGVGDAIDIYQDGASNIKGVDGANLIIEAGSNENPGVGLSMGPSVGKISDLNINIISAGSCIYGANINIENCNIVANSYFTDILNAENMEYYVESNSIPAIGGGAYTIKNTTIDAIGPKMAIGFHRSFNVDSDAEIMDVNDNKLNTVYIHERGEIYSYSFSKQPANKTYEGFEEIEKHVIIKNNHQLTKHDAVTPTCTHAGNIEYYSCDSCGIYFSDAQANKKISLESTILPIDSNNHTAGQPVKENEVAATKDSEGSYDEVVYCTECQLELSRTKKVIKKLSESDGTTAKDGEVSSGESETEEIIDAGDTKLPQIKNAQKECFSKLKAKATKCTNSSIKLTWSKQKGADGYLIYGNKCGKKNSYKLIKTISKNSTTSFTQKKLKKGTYYRYKIVAYKNVGGKKSAIISSKPIYVTTSAGKYGNPKSVKIQKLGNSKKNLTQVTIKKGKTIRISAKVEKEKKTLKTYRKLGYETSNKKIATVTSKGIIKGIKKGTCYVYVYVQNGVYRKVKVVVN